MHKHRGVLWSSRTAVLTKDTESREIERRHHDPKSRYDNSEWRMIGMAGGFHTHPSRERINCALAAKDVNVVMGPHPMTTAPRSTTRVVDLQR